MGCCLGHNTAVYPTEQPPTNSTNPKAPTNTPSTTPRSKGRPEEQNSKDVNNDINIIISLFTTPKTNALLFLLLAQRFTVLTNMLPTFLLLQDNPRAKYFVRPTGFTEKQTFL